MVRALLGPMLLLAIAAPERDARELLKVAWASQYEWKEDGVVNATLEFDYAGLERARDNSETTWEGHGQLVVVDDEIRRIHAPGIDGAQREELGTHLAWVVRRFARKGFETAFEDVEVGGPEPGAGEVLKVAAGPRVFLLLDDRIVGEEVDVGTPESPYRARADHVVRPMGGGYGILGTTLAYTRAGVKTSMTQRLALREGAKIPAPQRYAYRRLDPKDGQREWTIVFGAPTFNLDDPVLRDREARDLLAAAWERRFTLPAGIRIEAEFKREAANELKRAGWVSSVAGELQVWGLQDIAVQLDEARMRQRWIEGVRDTCASHFRWFFRFLDPTPFEQEFEGCGFERDPDAGGKGEVVKVYGYDRAGAFRVLNGALAGHLDVGPDGGWWDYRVKTDREGRQLIERLTRRVEGKKIELKFKYGRAGGFLVPKLVSAYAVAQRGRRGRVAGVVEYKLSRVRASLPD